LTPHTIQIGEKKYPVSDIVWRAKTISRPAGEINGIPAVRLDFIADNFPKRIPGTLYIVPGFCLQIWKDAGRSDAIAPDTSPESVIRGADGRIIGAKRWQI